MLTSLCYRVKQVFFFSDSSAYHYQLVLLAIYHRIIYNLLSLFNVHAFPDLLNMHLILLERL